MKCKTMFKIRPHKTQEEVPQIKKHVLANLGKILMAAKSYILPKLILKCF